MTKQSSSSVKESDLFLTDNLKLEAMTNQWKHAMEKVTILQKAFLSSRIEVSALSKEKQKLLHCLYSNQLHETSAVAAMANLLRKLSDSPMVVERLLQSKSELRNVLNFLCRKLEKHSSLADLSRTDADLILYLGGFLVNLFVSRDACNFTLNCEEGRRLLAKITQLLQHMDTQHLEEHKEHLDHTNLLAEHPKLLAEHPKLLAEEHPKLLAEHPKLLAEHPKLLAKEHPKLLAEHPKHLVPPQKLLTSIFLMIVYNISLETSEIIDETLIQALSKHLVVPGGDHDIQLLEVRVLHSLMCRDEKKLFQNANLTSEALKALNLQDCEAKVLIECMIQCLNDYNEMQDILNELKTYDKRVLPDAFSPNGEECKEKLEATVEK